MNGEDTYTFNLLIPILSCHNPVSISTPVLFGVIGLEVCDPHHRLMVSMVSGFFAMFAELLLPGLAVVCSDWPVLQAVATVPLLLIISYWW